MTGTRFTALLLAMLLALTCASFACADEEPSVYPLEGEHTLTIWTTSDADINTAGFSTYNDAPGFKAWQEQTGINVVVEESVDKSALLLRLNEGDLPDIIRETKTLYNKGFAAMLEDGIAVDLTETLPEFAPNYWAYINSDPNIYNSAAVYVDDALKIISFSGNFYPIDSPFRCYAGVIVRKDFMDKLGIESIVTVDDFKTYLKRCKDELGVKVPFKSQDTMVEYLWKYGYLSSAFGLINSWDYQVDGVYHFGAYEPEFKDVLAYLHDLYVEGLLDPDFAVTDNATAVASITSGDSAAISAMVSRFQVILNAADEGCALTAIPSLVAKEGDVPNMGYAVTIAGSSFWTYITEECEDLEAACRFLDYPFSPKGLDLANYGQEGVTFEYGDDGEPYLTDFAAHNPDGLAIDPITRAYGLANWPTIHRRAFSEKRFPLQEQRDACAIWGSSNYNDYMIGYSSVPSELQEEYTRLWNDISTYLGESIDNFIVGTKSLDEFDSYINDLKTLGMDRYIEIQQIAIDPYFAK